MCKWNIKQTMYLRVCICGCVRIRCTNLATHCRLCGRKHNTNNWILCDLILLWEKRRIVHASEWGDTNFNMDVNHFRFGIIEIVNNGHGHIPNMCVCFCIFHAAKIAWSNDNERIKAISWTERASYWRKQNSDDDVILKFLIVMWLVITIVCWAASYHFINMLNSAGKKLLSILLVDLYWGKVMDMY